MLERTVCSMEDHCRIENQAENWKEVKSEMARIRKAIGTSVCVETLGTSKEMKVEDAACWHMV